MSIRMWDRASIPYHADRMLTAITDGDVDMAGFHAMWAARHYNRIEIVLHQEGYFG